MQYILIREGSGCLDITTEHSRDNIKLERPSSYLPNTTCCSNSGSDLGSDTITVLACPLLSNLTSDTMVTLSIMESGVIVTLQSGDKLMTPLTVSLLVTVSLAVSTFPPDPSTGFTRVLLGLSGLLYWVWPGSGTGWCCVVPGVSLYLPILWYVVQSTGSLVGKVIPSPRQVWRGSSHSNMFVPGQIMYSQGLYYQAVFNIDNNIAIIKTCSKDTHQRPP